MIHSTAYTADTILHKLKNNERCYYVRFGDGELLLMDGQDVHPEQKWSEPLQRELIESFQIDDPDYLVASVAGMENEEHMRDRVFARFSNDVELQRIQERYRRTNSIYNAIALHYKYCFDAEWWREFLKQIDAFASMLGFYFIGPKAVAKVIEATYECSDGASFGGAYSHIIADRNAYDEMHENELIFANMLPDVTHFQCVLLACGPASSVIAKRLWYAGYKGAVIDIGSIADCLAGIQSRGWIRKVGMEARKQYG